VSPRVAVRSVYTLVCWLWKHGGDGWDHTVTTKGSLVSTRKS
jgi:hypothetical protein